VPAKTTVGLYWASGPTLADALEPIDKPIVSQAIPAGQPVGSYGPFHIDRDSSARLHWTTNLLAVVDPQNVITEFNEDNNLLALPLPDLAATAFNWHVPITLNSSGGVDFTYQVSGASVPSDTTVNFYWASGRRWRMRLSPSTSLPSAYRSLLDSRGLLWTVHH